MIGSLDNFLKKTMARPRVLSDEDRRVRKRLANLRYYYWGPTGDPRGRKKKVQEWKRKDSTGGTNSDQEIIPPQQKRRQE